MGTSLKDVIERTLDVLADPGNKAREHLKELAERQGPAALADLVDPKYSVEGSIGIGTIADVPWFMVLPPVASGSAQKGAYVVYLFAADGSAVYLSLNQGTERVKGGQAPLKKRAIDLREAAGPQSDLLISIDLQSRNTRPRKYEAANAYAKAYEKGAVPLASELEADLDRFLALLDKADPVATKFDPVFEPTHLVLKWSSDTKPETVSLHKEIADEKGSVWWGSFGDPSSPGIGTKTLQDLRAQLEAGVVTHAYLYGGDAVWRTNLEQIETDPTSVDFDRFPTYYRLEDCDLFLRLE